MCTLKIWYLSLIPVSTFWPDTFLFCSVFITIKSIINTESTVNKNVTWPDYLGSEFSQQENKLSSLIFYEYRMEDKE